LLSTPYDLILCNNPLCQTLSNALEKSQKTKQLISLFSSEFRMQLIPELNFTFNGRTIPITNSHKHLGVTFSSDAKWNIHIENILSSIYKHLNVLRKLKYKLSRKHLEKLYLVYEYNQNFLQAVSQSDWNIQIKLKYIWII
jgi:hypothetical protein